MSENDVREKYLRILRSDFAVQEEVKGRHLSGKGMRLDAALRPLKKAGWKNPDVALGIEFKDTSRFSRNYDTKNLTSWLAQCVDYANTSWDDYGFLYVFACPSLVDAVSRNVLGNEMFVRNFMGQMGVGELKEIPKYGLSILLHGHHRIWSQHVGLESGRHYNLKRKFGSR